MLLHKLTIYDKEDELIEKTLLDRRYARLNKTLLGSWSIEEKLSYFYYGGAALMLSELENEALAKRHFSTFLKSRSKVKNKKDWDNAANAILIVEEALIAGEENILLTSSLAYIRTMACLLIEARNKINL